MSKSSKGGNWEREVCRKLTVWLNGDPKKPIFWRMPGSGMMQTVHGDENLSGDIKAVRKEGEFLTSKCSIECKNGYDDVSLDKFLKNNKSDPLKSFWEQCINDSSESNKLPMVIYRKKGLSTPWVCIDDKFYYLLSGYSKYMRFIYLNWNNELPDMYIFEMNDFFKSITPDIMKEALDNAS